MLEAKSIRLTILVQSHIFHLFDVDGILELLVALCFSGKFFITSVLLEGVDMQISIIVTIMFAMTSSVLGASQSKHSFMGGAV